MQCKTCGESMEGDGYTVVLHCPNLDLIGEGYEPDANPVHCTEEQEQHMPTVQSLFNDRVDHALESEEQVLGRELHGYEVEGLQVHIAAQMRDEFLITDLNEVLS